jgi:DNA-binding IclR family transcriptional regulator
LIVSQRKATMSETSVERAFAILETFEQERRPLSLKELAQRCSMPPSTCHALVHTMIRRTYLYHANRRKDVYPTRRIFDMGQAIVASDPILQRLRPVMARLRDETRETVILGKRQGDRILYLDVIESPEVIRYSARPGDTKPLASTCIGKAMLAQLDPGEARAWLEANPPGAVTPQTITAIDALLADLDEGRRADLFVTRGENVADVSALAVPITLADGHLGIAVAGPSHRIEPAFASIAEVLRAARDSLDECEAIYHD